MKMVAKNGVVGYGVEKIKHDIDWYGPGVMPVHNDKYIVTVHQKTCFDGGYNDVAVWYYGPHDAPDDLEDTEVDEWGETIGWYIVDYDYRTKTMIERHKDPEKDGLVAWTEFPKPYEEKYYA